ncbi:MAG: hypothetical protein RL481_2369 [Pseudomonadota bacterium]|jgi:hypothetical protein
MAKTAEIATGFDGDKLYQRRARLVLPILVRQAKADQPIYYEDLADEVGMPNPRNLNYPLGCIGDALNDLSAEWEDEIPHIQALVKNQHTNLPGPGFDGFLEQKGEKWSNAKERRAIIEAYWAKIAAYPYWDDVLDALKLAATATDLAPIIAEAGRGGGGEGPEHLALKNFVCANPHLVGLKLGDPVGRVEHDLPSGDFVDVVFAQKRRIHAVEVKPAGSSVLDITRGLFQCVKYRAVLAARAAYEHDDREITAALALGGVLPSELIPLRNSIGVDVFESIVPE